jgi:hypothetical protein
MSLHKFAEQVAASGRGDDSLLVHMTPDEVQRLQAFAEANGTTLTINPNTGLPEAGFLSDLFKAVAPIALGAFLGPGAFGIAGMGLSAGTAGLVTGGLTTLATGSLSRGLMAGLGAYGGAGLAEGLMGTGTSALAADATGVASGQMMSDTLAERGIFPTLEGGAVNPEYITEANKAVSNAVSQGTNASTAAKMSAGLGSVANDPLSFAKDNFKYLGMAAAPIMADMMTPTVTKMPDLQNNSQISKYIRNEDGTLRHLYNAPAANYGTPAWKPFNEGGIVALAGGGDLNNIYANLGGKQVYDKITADYLKAGGTEAGLPSIFSAYDKPVAAPAAVAAPVVAAPAAPNLNNIYTNLGGDPTKGKVIYDKIASDYVKAGGTEAGLPSILSQYDKPVAAPAVAAATLTPQQQAMELMYRSTTGGVNTSALDALGGNAAVRDLATQGGFVATPVGIANYERTMGYQPSASTVANTKLATDNLPGLYASLGGGDVTKGKAAYDKIAADYVKAGGNVANLASVLYDQTAGTFYNPERLSTNSVFKPNALGYSEEDINRYVNSDAAKILSRFTGEPITAESYIQDTLASGKRFAAASGLFSPEEIAKMSNKQLLAAAELFTQGGGARKINGYTQQDVDFIRNEANNYGGLLYSALFQAIGDKGDVIGRQADEAAGRYGNGTADTTGTIGSQVTSNGIVDLKTDTSVKQDKTDNTTVGKSTLATTKPADIKSNITTDGTYTGTSGVAPAVNTVFGQGKYTGTGSEMGTGTTGPIVDFGGVSPFGTTSPMALAKTQIADEAAAKTAADKAKLDLYSQWGASNPTATALDRANFMDKLGLPPETTAALRNISPDQAKSEYYNAKFDQQTGDSQAAYKYLMGQGAYPTKSKVGEIARPYAEATLGYPASTNRQFIYDQATGKYNRNPDYVAEYRDPTGAVNYALSPAEIFNYFKTNANQGDDATYSWAVANNLTPQDIANATGVSLSQVAAKWRVAKANKAAVTNEDGTVDETKLAEQQQANFDPTAYLKANPDVQAELDSGKANFGTKDDLAAAAWNHYLNYGKAGGRAYTKKAAGGGMMGYAVGGGLGSLGSYSDGGRLLRGPGDGVSDSIPATIGDKQQPARLADGEFVVPARIVSELGNGSTEAGAKKLYAMMDRVQRARGKTTGKNKVAANSRADKYLPA